MSEVKLQVGGRHYTVSVADGQEENLRKLAGAVDAKITGMGQNVSTNEAKNLLFAAILLADELDEAKAKAAHPPDPGLDSGKLADKLERLAVALENAATRLEGGPQAT